MAVNPDGMKAQIEGGILYGLSAALNGEITIAKGAWCRRTSPTTKSCAGRYAQIEVH